MVKESAKFAEKVRQQESRKDHVMSNPELSSPVSSVSSSRNNLASPASSSVVTTATQRPGLSPQLIHTFPVPTITSDSPYTFPFVQLLSAPSIQFQISETATGPHWFIRQGVLSPASLDLPAITQSEQKVLDRIFESLQPLLRTTLRRAGFPFTDSPPNTNITTLQLTPTKEEYDRLARLHEEEYVRQRRAIFSYLRQQKYLQEKERGEPHEPIPDDAEERIPLVVEASRFDTTRPRTGALAAAFRDALVHDIAGRCPRRRSLRLRTKQQEHKRKTPRRSVLA